MVIITERLESLVLYVKNTPNTAGVYIYGDYLDLERLYDALHELVGTEDENLQYDTPRLRVLGLCYDIRHAMQGDRDIEFVDNGMTPEKMKLMSTITPDKNLYLRLETLWPEIIFVTMALNDFVMLYARKKAKGIYRDLTDSRVVWDETLAWVRMLQAAVTTCLKETLPESSYKRMLKLMNKDMLWTSQYVTHWVDVQNTKFLKMSPEKRLKSISTMAKRLTEIYSDEYRSLSGVVWEAARKYQTSIDNIRINVEYPDDWEW